MQTTDKIILLFTKFPLPGHCKTRLIPALGPERAALLQKKMTETIITTISRLQKTYPHTLEIHYDGGSPTHMRSWLGDSHLFKQQPDTSLGTRIEVAIRPHLHKNMAIIVIGADCPAISEDILRNALTSLQEHEVVIGPTYDGGYYLIGVNGGLWPETLHTLFQEIPWGTDTVFAETMDRVKHLNLKHHILGKLHDIDTPEDLRHINYHSDTE